LDPERKEPLGLINTRQKILVVDDELEVVELLKKYLERRGYQVITAGDGLQGFKYACEQKPDLILLDIVMPGADGMTVLKKLRAEESTRKIPVIMITTKRWTDSIFEAEGDGATDYIMKPFEFEELLEFVKRYI